jgi:hypothetical protein
MDKHTEHLVTHHINEQFKELGRNLKSLGK